MRATFLVVLATGCASHIRTEIIGRGAATVSPRGNPAPPAAGMPLPQGAYEIALWLDLPRAQLVDWSVVCPGVDMHGTLGESFEAYRGRRLAEITRDREREAQVAGSLAGAVLGGRVEAHARVAVALPPGDVGAQRVTTTFRTATAANGACTVTAVADDATVAGGFQVTRIRDLDAEAREQAAYAAGDAMRVRGVVTAHLLASGADPEVRARRLAAEAARRAAAEAELRRRDEVVAVEARRVAAIEERRRADVEAIELRHRDEAEAVETRRRSVELVWTQHAYATRELVVAWLVACGGDPGRRARLAAEQDVEARARAATQAAEEQRRAAARVVELRLAAELDARQTAVALQIRGRLRASLIGFGAVDRPPMPEPIAEAAGAPPFSGARWIAGRWTWTGSTWSWTRGGWRDTSRFDAAGDAGVAVAAPEPPPIAPTAVTIRPVVGVPPVVVRPAIVIRRQPPPPPPPPRRDRKRPEK